MNYKDESSHNWRTELPNIVFDIGLRPLELAVYMAIKRAAGDKGGCFKSMANLAKLANVDIKTCRNAKKRLAMDQPIIGMPLIRVSERFSEAGDQDTDLITIVDIWPINFKYYFGVLPKTEGGGTKNGSTVVPKTVGGVVPKTGDKEEPIEEDPLNNSRDDNFFYPCLIGVKDIAGNEIPQKDAVWLTNNYDEQTVKDSVEYHRRKKGPYDKPLQAILKWYCRDKPEMPYSEEEIIQHHKEISSKIIKIINCPSTVIFDFLRKGIEVRYSTGQAVPDFIEYTDYSFKDKLKMILIKYIKFIPNQAISLLVNNSRIMPTIVKEEVLEPELDYANF